MLTRERTPFTEDPTPPSIMERAESLFAQLAEFFAPSRLPGSNIESANENVGEGDEPEIDETGAIRPRSWRDMLKGLWHDPLFVRLPFEERRMGMILASLLAITLYVAFLAIAMNSALGHAAAGMDRDLGKRVTYEVVADTNAPEQMKDRQSRAVQLVEKLRNTPGVASVTPLSDDKMTQLLKPWLGTAQPPADLPLPALIDVELANDAPAKDVLNEIANSIPGVMLDDHASWEQALTRAADALGFTSLYVLLLGFVALALTACFAAETHFHINRETIEILHLIGARDSAIARHMGIAVLRLSLVAACLALLVACLTLGGLVAGMRGLDLSFFPNFALSGWHITGIVALWLGAAAVAMGFCFATAYFTVLRALQRLI